ncbi:MAG: hypothetical protein AAF487_10965, partial [Bacteroidota bacterium]
MGRIVRLILLLFFISFPFLFIAQECNDARNKKVEKLLEQANNRKKYELRERYNFLRDAIEEEENCLECHYRLAMLSYRRAKSNANVSFSNAEKHFREVDIRCPEFHSDIPYHLGMIAYAKEEYKKALNYFNYFLKFPDDDPDRMSKKYDDQYDQVKAGLKDITFYAEMFENEVPFNPVLVKGVSSRFDEYLPLISPDNEMMLYTRKVVKTSQFDIVKKSQGVEEFTLSKRPDFQAIFDSGEPMESPFNLGDNYGGACLSIDNKEMFITTCKPIRVGNQSYNNCDIMVTRLENTFSEAEGKEVLQWTELESVSDNINGKQTWESQPSLSSDGQTLYFATHRDGTLKNEAGESTIDIYYSTRTSSGWSPAKRVEGGMNTNGNDKAPFMHGDSKTLYFSSDGLLGLGGYDLFFTRLNDDGSWTSPKSLGYPINTVEDEHGLIVSTDGNLAYYASKRAGGVGGLDIYSFELPEAAKPEKVVLIKGESKDEEGEVVRDAKIELKYAETKEIEVIEIKDDGSYARMINVQDQAVVMTIKKENKAFQARVFSKEKADERPIAKIEAPLEDVAVGKAYTIDDIYYETASSEIDISSKLLLSEFAEYLKNQKSLRIEIRGHTDDIGQR